MRRTAFLWLATLTLLAGCATPPRHPALAGAEAAGTLPPLVPMRRFVANIDYAGGYSLSPDGAQLVWSQAVGTDSGLAVRAVHGGTVRTFATGFLARPVGPIYTWLPDSRHIVYLKDLRGDENTHLHVFDSSRDFAPWAVTPWPGVRSHFVAHGAPGSAKFFFASNRRDRSTLDLYEADAEARSIREVARSDGKVLNWFVGTDNQLAARFRQLQPQDGSDGAFEVLEADGRWRTVKLAGGWDSLWIHRVDRQAGKAWAMSNLGRERNALVEIDLATGAEKVLAAHGEVDLQFAYYPRTRGAPVGYFADAGYPTANWLDTALGAETERAVQRAMERGWIPERPRFVRPQSASDDGQRWVMRAIGDFDDAELLLDRATGEVARLDRPEPEKRELLSREEPYAFTTSDGRKVHGYLVRPRGVDKPAPMVVVIHGGPWVRDSWQSAWFTSTQMLANRGYAVLNVNYRGSWGYGRDFMMAAKRAYATRLQQDIAEAAQWAVDRGYADPTRMAVLGASFGGYSTLMQLARKDHDWRCGVDIVGVANWARVIENWPPFWRNRHMFHAFYGDPAVPAERAEMLANSPVSHLDRITAPLLVIHGANDIRVLRQDSDDVVAGLRALGRPVEYLSFPDEGHAVRRWRNRMEMWRRVEDTLAACLGGRSAGWDFYEIMPPSQ
ncbi:S9 family peptidase [Ramlibacter sp. USB13]|uniref:S9 family peptidase n=1 Tax=Ramlibacter cellulosilyticus TaxID=2764187 RepID=A0A923MMV5_9BURK|nr:prolyl oligopeptidase family serine peptidase [Ramlibacter cellulosilyticus]MBC5781334.1 S9 family peptidase [Ramlibacter cellulosilyticus]